MTPSAIEIRNLSFSYTDRPNVLNNLNLSLNEGSRLGVIGSNGSGKTTLFLLICGVLTPNSGEVNVYKKKVQPGQFNPLVGYVFQNPDDHLFSPTVYEDIAFGPLNLGYSRTDVDNMVTDILLQENLLHLKDRPTQHLSDGEKRKISLLSVLVMKPKILILDEPSSNLDMHSRRELIQLLEYWNGTLIISSHDLEFIIETCNSTLLLNNGSVEAFGNTSSILSNELLMKKCRQEIPWSLKGLENNK